MKQNSEHRTQIPDNRQKRTSFRSLCSVVCVLGSVFCVLGSVVCVLGSGFCVLSIL